MEIGKHESFYYNFYKNVEDKNECTSQVKNKATVTSKSGLLYLRGRV